MRAVCVVVVILAVLSAARAQDSLGMRRVSTLDYWQGANDIQMVGSFAYIVGGLSGLHIVDLSDPSQPHEIGRVTWYASETGGGVCVSGGRAYIGTGVGGSVYDVSDPSSPTLLGTWSSASGISDLLVHGNVAFATSPEGGTYMTLDVSDPANVHMIGYISCGINTAIGMAGDYLCMSGFGLTVWDISDPTSVVEVAACDTETMAWQGTVSGNYAYLATPQDGVHIIDVSNPLQPTLVSVCDSGSHTEYVMVTGNYVYVTEAEQGLSIWDITNPSQPTFAGTVSSHGFWNIATCGSLVCAAEDDAHPVVVLDISDPAVPVEVSSFGMDGMLQNEFIHGNAAYLADPANGLRIVDISDPGHTFELGNTRGFSAGAVDVAIKDNYAYMSEDHWGFRVFDVSNPAQPESITCMQCDHSFNFGAMVVEGDYAYVVGGRFSGSLRTYGLQNPAAPVLLDSVECNGGNGLTVLNGYLYTLSGFAMYVYSLGNPAAPVLTGSCDLPHGLAENPCDLAIAGNYGYVANQNAGIRIIDISDPTNPHEVGYYNGIYWRVAATGSTLLASGGVDISVLNLADPLHPSWVGFYGTDEYLYDMEIAGPYLYTVSDSRLAVYQCDALAGAKLHPETPHEFALRPCYPNPFNPSTVIRFSLPQMMHAKLTVYDITGRQVKVLTDGVLSVGEHQVMFDGSELASGVYFARLEAGKNVQTEKLMLLK